MGYSWSRKQALKDSHDETKSALRVIDVSSLISVTYDAGSVEYPSSTQVVYKFRQGGISGTIVATLTLNYTNSTKEFLLNWAVT